MARINLLPWRKEQRERRNKEFNVLALATAGLAALAIILVWSVLNKDLSNQQDANKRIEDANAQLDVALKSIEELETQREQMLSQMKVIQDLQGRRSIPVRVWDDMARAVPEAMYLNNIKREADVITLTGFADNPNVVAALVRNLNASEWLDGSAVVSIKSKLEAYQDNTVKTQADADKIRHPEDNYIEFVVTSKIQYPQTEEEKAQAGANTETADVPMPATNVDVGAMPEVTEIGIDNAPATPAPTPATPAAEPVAAPAAPAPEGNAPAKPVADANTSTVQNGTSQNAQPAISSTQAGGQS